MRCKPSRYKTDLMRCKCMYDLEFSILSVVCSGGTVPPNQPGGIANI